MLRTALRPSYRSLRTTQRAQRSFVSTVLLSKTYEDKTVAELRTELRARGLSMYGNKATLISRIQQADARNAVEPTSSTSRPPSVAAHASSQTTIRGVSSSSAARAEITPNQPDSIPPLSSAHHVKFDIKLPDVSQDPPEPHVQVPFVPDFWESSIKNAEEASSTSESSSSTPKIMLAAGANTYPAGGPTYAMSPATDTLPSNDLPSHTSPKKYEGLVGDVFDDLGIPHNVLSATPHSATESSHHELAAKRTFNRPLDEEERRGALTLLGLIFGAWVAAGLAAPSRGKSKGIEKH